MGLSIGGSSSSRRTYNTTNTDDSIRSLESGAINVEDSEGTHFNFVSTDLDVVDKAFSFGGQSQAFLGQTFSSVLNLLNDRDAKKAEFDSKALEGFETDRSKLIDNLTNPYVLSGALLGFGFIVYKVVK